MPVRSANAVWEGNLQDGTGNIRIGDGRFESKYSSKSRFEEGTGTNPEELIAAAHAGCFSMAFSGDLARAGFKPQRITTTARAHLGRVDGGFRITAIDLETEADVPEIDDDRFRQIAETAKNNCPVSQALKGVDIRLNARRMS